MPQRDKLIRENYPEFKHKDYKLAFLDIFKETSNDDNDEVNKKIWGILTESQKNDIKESFNWDVQHTASEIKKNIIEIIKLRDSLNSKKNLYITSIEDLIKKQSKNNFTWFEFFIWDAIERELLSQNNNELSFEKPWHHIDQFYSTDLICSFVDYKWEKKNLWVDLTFARQKHIVKKKTNKIHHVNKQLKKWVNDYSNIRTPDKTSLLKINPQAMKSPHECYMKAIEQFYSAKDYKWWPSKYLEKKVQNRLKNFSIVIISIFEKIKKNDFKNYELEWNKILIYKNENKVTFIVSRENKLLFEYNLPI